jgi:lysozyme family protein
MTERYLKFIKIVKKFENGPTINGYVNDPKDAGGETVSGVTRKNHPELKVWESLDKLDDVAKKKAYQPTKDEWNEIYKLYYDSYYLMVKAEELTDEQIAIQVFDTAVNAGVSRSIKILQEIVGHNPDGIINPDTITAANSNKETSELFRKRRIKFLEELAILKPNNKKFLKGWIARANKCKV